MTDKVNIKAVIEALESQSEELSAFFNTKTHEFVSVSQDDLDAIDTDSLSPEALDRAREIFESDDYIALPDFFDLNEYDLMQTFVEQHEDPKIRTQLQPLTRGNDALRRFKNALPRYSLQKAWKNFCYENYKETAEQWCRDHNLAF